MHALVRSGLALLLAVWPALPRAAAETYDIDTDHTEVRLTWDHLGLSRQGGRFTGVKGTVDFDTDAPAESRIDVEIPLKGLTTGVKKLDEQLLQTREFFDVAAHPTITFKSTSVTMKSDRTADVAGDLTIGGISRPVVLDVLWNGSSVHPLAAINPAYAGKFVAGFSATTQIRRSDWGITRGAPFVSDELKITIETELHRNVTEADAELGPLLPAEPPVVPADDASEEPPAAPAQ